MFDDSALSDDKSSAVNTNHENLRTKLVSKRSVSDPSDSNNENVGLWQRLKRGVKNLFGIKNGDENAHQQEVEIPKVEELKAVTAQKSQSQHETSKKFQDNTMRRKRHRTDDDDDDEEDDDEDNEINGSGEHDVIPDIEDKLVVDLPDVDDSQRCKFALFVWFLQKFGKLGIFLIHFSHIYLFNYQLKMSENIAKFYLEIFIHNYKSYD